MISRRGFLGGALALSACSPHKGTGFPGFAIIASEGERSLTSVSLLQFRIARQLALESAPSQLMALDGPKLVLALLPDRGTVVAVDSEGFAIRHKIRVGDASMAMLLDEDGKRLWVLNKSPNALVEVDLASFKSASRVKLPGEPGSFDRYETTTVVSVPSQGNLAVIRNGRVERSIATGMTPEMVLFRKDGQVVMAGDSEGQMLAVADPATGQLLVKLPLAVKPRRYCRNLDGGQLFISGDGMDAVAIVSPYQTEVGETILAGRSPAGMAVTRTESPSYLFVTNSVSGDVTVIDINTRRVVARIPVGQDPQDVIITPDNQYALVLNRKSGDMAVIRVPSIEAWGNHHNKTAPLFTMIPVGARPVSAAICAA